jgi:hypothetical protein
LRNYAVNAGGSVKRASNPSPASHAGEKSSSFAAHLCDYALCNGKADAGAAGAGFSTPEALFKLLQFPQRQRGPTIYNSDDAAPLQLDLHRNGRIAVNERIFDEITYDNAECVDIGVANEGSVLRRVIVQVIDATAFPPIILDDQVEHFPKIGRLVAASDTGFGAGELQQFLGESAEADKRSLDLTGALARRTVGKRADEPLVSLGR